MKRYTADNNQFTSPISKGDISVDLLLGDNKPLNFIFTLCIGLWVGAPYRIRPRRHHAIVRRNKGRNNIKGNN